jgi:hypothetical protein
MTTRHTRARRVAFMGLAISMAASSWASAHGRTGAMATAGAVIASAVAEEEAIAAPVETVVDVFLPPIADMAQRLYAPATAAHLTGAPPHGTPTPQRRIVARLMALPTPKQREAAHLMVAPMPQHRMVARPMVEDRMVAANANSR